MSDNINEVLGNIQTAVTALRETDIAELKSADVLNIEQMGRINADIDRMKSSMEALEQKAARPSIDSATADAAEYGAAYSTWARKGVGEFEMDQKAITLNEADANGVSRPGVLAPRTLETGINKALEVLSPIRAEATVITIAGNDYRFLRANGNFEAGWVGETDTRPETATNTLSEVAVPGNELYAFPFASQWALDDVAFNLEQYMIDEVSESFAKYENAAFIAGDGNKKPQGILTTSGIKTVNTGVAYNNTTKAGMPTSGDAYIQMVYGLGAAYRAGSKWLMASAGQSSVRTLKDNDGSYIWQNSLIAGQPDSILGYSIVTAEEMPGVAANALPIAFGNIRQGYLIVDRKGITTIRDPFTKKPYVGLYMTKRVSGIVKDTNAFVLMKVGA